VALNPKRAIRLLESLISESEVSSGRESWVELTLYAESVEKLIDLDALHAGAIKIPEAERSKRAAEGIQLLKRALENKKAGKPYGLIRPKGSRFYG